jgi:hypothetical protein
MKYVLGPNGSFIMIGAMCEIILQIFFSMRTKQSQHTNLKRENERHGYDCNELRRGISSLEDR